MASAGESPTRINGDEQSCAVPPRLEYLQKLSPSMVPPSSDPTPQFTSSATNADLKRLISRATPRSEDVRSVDRCDIIRRDHGHMSLREVTNSVDALEFSVDSFARCMQEIRDAAAEDGAEVATTSGPATAVDGLLQIIGSLRLLAPSDSSAPSEAKVEEETEACEPAEKAKDAWQAVAAQIKKTGGEHFQKKDFAAALSNYSAAIRATPARDESLNALFSNRSACLLQLGRPIASLTDAERCTELAPEWPKGHFRKGSCLRELKAFEEAAAAFRQGQVLEPANKDWEKEVEKCERLHRALPETQARQLIWHLMPEILQAWTRAGSNGGVVQVQVNGPLEEFGTPKWQLVRDRKDLPKANFRWCFVDEKAYMANLAGNLAKSPVNEGVAVVDLKGQPLRIPDVRPFISVGESEKASVTFEVSVKLGGKMVAILGRVDCDEDVRPFLPKHKDPPAPKGEVIGALQTNARAGFPKVLPRFLGFQTMPGGDLNFPVIDLDRDCPGAMPVVNTGSK